MRKGGGGSWGSLSGTGASSELGLRGDGGVRDPPRSSASDKAESGEGGIKDFGEERKIGRA